MGAKRLRQVLGKLGRASKGRKLDVSPDSPFDALLEQRIQALERQVEELKGRINGLMLAVAGAVIIQLILGLMR